MLGQSREGRHRLRFFDDLLPGILLHSVPHHHGGARWPFEVVRQRPWETTSNPDSAMRRIALTAAPSARRRILPAEALPCTRRFPYAPFFPKRSLTYRSSSRLTCSASPAASEDPDRHLQVYRRWRQHGARYFSSPAPLPPPDDSRGHALQVAPTSTTDTSAFVSSEPPTITYTPVDFELKAKIEGEESHIVTIELDPGECVRAESGSMIFMTDTIHMNTSLGGAGAGAAFQRMMTGQNLFLTDFVCTNGPGTLCLGTDFPSKILRLNLQEVEGEALICQRGAYLASNPTVNIEMAFTKSLSAGFFGGQGFVLQKLTGQGDVLVKGGGTIVVHDLHEGEKWRVTSGSIVAFESSVDYDIQMMPGIKNAMFGGEGLFVTTLTGPGRVWLQGMPPDRMIAEIARRVPSGGGLGFGIPIMGGGGGGGEGGGDASDAAAAAGAADATAAGGPAVAATDAAMDADRQATVASSGAAPSDDATAGPVEADSPSALFGDAAPQGTPAPAPSADDGASTFGSPETAAPSEPSFEEDMDAFSTSASSEPSFDDTTFSDEFSHGSDASDGELFDDTFTSESADASGDAASSEGGSSILSTLWDFFMGDDE